VTTIPLVAGKKLRLFTSGQFDDFLVLGGNCDRLKERRTNVSLVDSVHFRADFIADQLQEKSNRARVQESAGILLGRDNARLP